MAEDYDNDSGYDTEPEGPHDGPALTIPRTQQRRRRARTPRRESQQPQQQQRWATQSDELSVELERTFDRRWSAIPKGIQDMILETTLSYPENIPEEERMRRAKLLIDTYHRKRTEKGDQYGYEKGNMQKPCCGDCTKTCGLGGCDTFCTSCTFKTVTSPDAEEHGLVFDVKDGPNIKCRPAAEGGSKRTRRRRKRSTRAKGKKKAKRKTQAKKRKTRSMKGKSSVAGYGYYSINIGKYSVADIKKEWGKILRLAKSFPGFIEGKLMFPATPLYVRDPSTRDVFAANVVAYGRWKTKRDDHRWVEKALHNGWGFNDLHPAHKVHVTMIEK